MEKRVKSGVIAIGIIVAFAGGFVVAQETSGTEKKKADFLGQNRVHKLDAMIAMAKKRAMLLGVKVEDKDKPSPQELGGANAFILDYTKAANDSDLTNALAGTFYSDYLYEEEASKTAPQLSNAHEKAMLHFQMLQVAQNQRIIELLEKMQPTQPKKP
jgi:fructose-specific component phosphotransferase system IIB-like protein